jgi:TRAP-type C4-dicarboxylate transport system substrate-binding protein
MPPSDDLYSKYIAVNLVNKIKEATNGQIEVTPYSGGALVPPTEIFKSVASGIVELGYTATSYQIGFIPVTAVVDGLPMSFRNYQDLLTLYRQKGLGDILSTEYDKNGVHLLTLHATEAYTVLSSKALKTKADWQGAKIRGWGIWNQYFGKLGASAVDMPLKDVYMALSLKTIDGVLTGVNPHYQLKHYEVCKYGVWPPLQGSSSHDLYINNDVWKSLPDNLKQSLTQACSQWTDDTAEKWYQFSLENKNNLSSKGVQWIEPDDRAWLTENAISLWAETAAKDAPSAKAVKIMTDYLKEQGVVK